LDKDKSYYRYSGPDTVECEIAFRPQNTEICFLGRFGLIREERKRNNDDPFPKTGSANPEAGGAPRRKRVRILHTPKSTESIDRREALAKMEQALKDPECDPKPDTPIMKSLLDRLRKKSLPAIDIYKISEVAFHCYIKKVKSEFFFISLSQIKQIIEDRLRGEAEENKKEIL
jgi:hypothetical protein